MAKMGMDELRAMLAAEYDSAMGALQASRLVTDRADALDYYFGHMQKDMPAGDGRSQAVSFDVADTIEGLMPSLMEIFAGSDEVVQFDPVGPEDVEAAQQETDYTNHVFMNENPGFMVLYTFMKDALLSKVGIVKIFWDQREEEEKETYYDQPDDAFGLIVSSPDIDVVEHSERIENGQTLHDVTVKRKKDYSQAKVMNVPPEEFVITRGARTLKDANYVAHKVIATEARLIEMGYDPDQVRDLPTYRAYTNIEEIDRDTVDEHQFFGDDVNKAARLKEVIEHYCRLDYEGTGKARLYRVTTSGATSGSGEVMLLDGKPDIQEWDEIPFATICPIPVTHRFFGRSIADVTMDIQRVKTAMLRGALDNIYLALQPRVEVAESHMSDNTLDDLLVSRPGGIFRTKQPGGVNWQEVPNITGSIFPALEYYDQLREWRTGVSRMSQGLEPDALQDQTATAVQTVYSASQAKMKLIARLFAETGIRDMFYLLHGCIRKHSDKARTVRLRNQWVTVDPRNWKTRNDMTVTVGTGTGGRQQRLAEVQLLAAAQERMLTGGMTNMVTPQNLYSTAKILVRALGEKDVDAFFTDPSKNPQQQQPPPDPKLQAIQLQAQTDQQQAQMDAQIKQQQMQQSAQLDNLRFEHERQMAILKAELDARDRDHQNILKAKQVEHDTALKTAAHNVAMQHERQKHVLDIRAKRMEMAAKGDISGSDLPPDPFEELTNSVKASHEALAKALQESHHKLLQVITAPRKSTLHRDKAGKATHATHEVDFGTVQ